MLVIALILDIILMMRFFFVPSSNVDATKESVTPMSKNCNKRKHYSNEE